MKTKLLLACSALPFLTASIASSADHILVAEPEPAEFVRVCNAQGSGYFYIPGTETCMRISGHIRGQIAAGDNISAKEYDRIERDSYAWLTQMVLRFHTISETDLGPIKTFIEMRQRWHSNGAREHRHHTDHFVGEDTSLRFAYMEIGGLRLGYDESIFHHWTGSYGKVMNDDVLTPASNRTNVISYTFTHENGFSATLGLEQGNNAGDRIGYRKDSAGNRSAPIHLSQKIDNYVPNIVIGAKYSQGWGAVSAVAAYDSYYSKWAGKLRLDAQLTDKFSVWTMVGYKQIKDSYGEIEKTIDGVKIAALKRQRQTLYGDWGGNWIVWGGATYEFTPKTSWNFQIARDEDRTFSSAMNISHELARGLHITPEVNYTSWNSKFTYKNPETGISLNESRSGKNAVQGVVRLQRSF